MADISEKQIEAFNKQQLEHIFMVQELVFEFCAKIMKAVLRHDESKFSADEYWTFVDARDSLNKAKSGNDEGYKKYLNTDAIQKHITSNPHHPEYWDKNGKTMPIEEAVIMFFDWYSRSKQRGTKMEDFWPTNLEKLQKQPMAKALVEYLKESEAKLEESHQCACDYAEKAMCECGDLEKAKADVRNMLELD